MSDFNSLTDVFDQIGLRYDTVVLKDSRTITLDVVSFEFDEFGTFIRTHVF